MNPCAEPHCMQDAHGYEGHREDSKVCLGCGESKPLEAFHVHKLGRLGRNPRCKVCRAKHQKASAATQAYQRRYQETHAAERAAKRRARYAADPEAGKAAVADWRRRNPDKLRANAVDWFHRRRARMLAGEYESIDRQAIYARDGGRCHICGKPVAPDAFDLDHLVPLSQGGHHVARNVAIAHPSCNRSRGAGRTPAQLRIFGEV